MLFGVTDFNTACTRDSFYPLSGTPIYYHRCNDCGLIYTNAFDEWSSEDYQNNIYNSDYIKFDPEYEIIRPQKIANFLLHKFPSLSEIKILDYGSGNGNGNGNGMLSEILRGHNVIIENWDPYSVKTEIPQNKFQLILCIEVFEHSPSPQTTVSQLSEMLDSDGVLFFTTLLNDQFIHQRMNHWYISPRNGHVTIYSEKSLSILFSKFGMTFKTTPSGGHIAYRNTSAISSLLSK